MTPPDARNQLRARAEALKTAYRNPISPGCDLVAPDSTPLQRRSSIIHIPIDTSAAGDTALISTLTGKKLILEILLWNVVAQNLALYQGPSASGILLFPWPAVPATTGLTLGFNGNFEQPHFAIEPGQPFVLNLQNPTRVTGFVNYIVAPENF